MASTRTRRRTTRRLMALPLWGQTRLNWRFLQQAGWKRRELRRLFTSIVTDLEARERFNTDIGALRAPR